MPDLPIIYTIRLDMQEDVTEEANLWNNTRHISDLLGSGFLSAVRFRSLKGEPEYLHLYELPNIDLLSTEAYKNVRKYDDWGPKLSHGFSNHSASLYNQIGDGEHSGHAPHLRGAARPRQVHGRSPEQVSASGSDGRPAGEG